MGKRNYYTVGSRNWMQALSPKCVLLEKQGDASGSARTSIFGQSQARGRRLPSVLAAFNGKRNFQIQRHDNFTFSGVFPGVGSARKSVRP